MTVHNLKRVDLDLPRGKWISFCGVSGSGKTSLALDTLYAEGQRRYLESFSAYTRQFLEQLDKPAAESIEGIPPAVAVTRKSGSRTTRATVGSTAQVNEYLQLLFARIGEVICYGCGDRVERDSADSIAEKLLSLPEGTRLMLGFVSRRGEGRSLDEWRSELVAQGYRRCLREGKTAEVAAELFAQLGDATTLEIVADRLAIKVETASRLRESLETALEAGRGSVVAWIEREGEAAAEPNPGRASGSAGASLCQLGSTTSSHSIDDRRYHRRSFSSRLRCEACDIEYPDVEPPLLNDHHPLGACPRCEGFGNVLEIDMARVVPDREKSLRAGAIAPWNTPAYKHELDELLALAGDYGLPVDVPFGELHEQHLRLIHDGVPEREFGGLAGFFRWLERRKYKTPIRVFLSRWRSERPCPDCGGARLRREALAVRIGGRHYADVQSLRVAAAVEWLRSLPLSEWQKQASGVVMEQILSRLNYLDQIGVGHLEIQRTLRTLSGGESQRVALTAALGSNLSGLLYVLDEPSAGLHPADLPRLIASIRRLRDRGNTVVAVEHEPTLIASADHVVEMGPGAGEQGGRVVFQGTPSEMLDHPESRTGVWLSGERRLTERTTRREATHSAIRLIGARGNNLQNLTVDFPLGLLCVVTGVSGSGKSTLVERTLFPAVAQRLKLQSELPAECDDVLGVGQLQDALVVDQSPIGRSPRSNPITYVKAFDPIRALFAETTDAQTRGFKAGHFSFNAAGGRCDACQGEGFKRIDMRLMADVYMRCGECHGTRYRREVLDVKYRGVSIAEVLDMSVREAFNFFRPHKKILSRLKCLIDVGLDYLRLGQPANTLSGGESQRLKLANYVGAARRGRTLFVMDEPTTGLHFSDILQLLDCFDSLIAMGHSLVIVEHNALMMQAADYLIDLGPGAGDAGGRIVAQGTPEQVAANPASLTGQCLAAMPR